MKKYHNYNLVIVNFKIYSKQKYRAIVFILELNVMLIYASHLTAIVGYLSRD